MKQYYEAHVTMQADIIYHPAIREFVEGCGWKFSAINGDINLGDGIKCYATRQYNTRQGEFVTVNILQEMADNCAKLRGVEVVRRKVEIVIFDDRSSKVCLDNCAECPSS